MAGNVAVNNLSKDGLFFHIYRLYPAAQAFRIIVVMIKKISLGLFASIFTFSVLGFIFSFGLSRIIQPQVTQRWIEKSGTYTELPNALLTRAQTIQTARGDSSIDYSNPLIRNAAKTALSESFLRESGQDINNATFNWLNGSVATPSFSIDLRPVKQSFVDTLATSLKDRYESLESCAPTQIPDSVDPFQINCRPSIEPAINAIIATESATLMQSTDFLANTELTANNILPTEAGARANLYNHAVLPSIYRAIQAAPYFFAILGTLSGTATLILADTKRRGARKIAWRLLLASILSVLLINLGALALTKVNEAATTQNTTAAITAYKTVVGSAINAIRHDSTIILLATTAPAILLGLVILLVTRTKKSTPKKTNHPEKKSAPTVTADKKDPAKPAAPRPQPQPAKVAPLLKPKQQQRPTVVTPNTRIGSNDRLIQ